MTESATASAAPDINARIAARIRDLRAQLGMSLDALASKSEVSRSMISLVERGESSPTATVLERIATGLGVSLASLFDDTTAPAKPLSHGSERIPWRDPASGYVRRNLSPPNYPSAIQLVEVMMPAGAHVAYENGDASIHQQIWVIDGSIEVTVGRTTHKLVADDCLAMQLHDAVAFHNRTRKSARYIVALASERSRAPRK